MALGHAGQDVRESGRLHAEARDCTVIMVHEGPAALVELRDWMRDVYAPAIEGAPNTVGRERYARWSRYFNGTDLDLDEAYAYGWSEYHRLLAEMKQEAEKILPGA